MATWREMSLENRKAAQTLALAGLLRSSISRSYYTAYCAITAELSGKLTFGHGGNNPSHAELPNLILHNLTRLEVNQRREIYKASRLLWKLRVEADYAPGAYVDKHIAINALRMVERVLHLLGVSDE